MANRWPAIAGACMWGIAVGLVAYRYAVLPLLWSSPWRHIVIGLAVGLAVGGRALLRTREGSLGVLVLAGVVGAGAAFGAGYTLFPTLSRAKLETRKFPGFSLALPRGEAVQDQTAGYATGKLALRGIAGSRSVLIVQWELGGEMTAEDMNLIAKMLSVAIPGISGESQQTSVAGPDGKPVPSVKFDSDKGVFELSSLVCGSRHVLVATGGEKEALGVHERIVASFACTPDPEREKTASVFSFPMNLDLPGWYATSRDPEAFELTDGVTATMTLRTLPAGMHVQLENVLEPIFRAAGLTQGLEVGAKLPDGRVPFKLTIEGETTRGWAALFPCPTATGLVVAIAADDGADGLHDKLAAARCRRDGEPVQTWPDPPAGADDTAVP
ncbi:MAG: hypothetical protein HOV81_45780 [Kofleriaceae bacterium]|nr:hypothetical protein [Kofleriaceae bacterium]